MIKVKNLSYSYDGNAKVLDDINLDINLKENTAILGPNGSGKSTFLYFLNTLLVAEQGYITISGEIVNKKNSDKIRSKMGFLFDNPDNQLFSPTVRDDVAFGPKNQGKSKEEINTLVNEALKLTGINDLADRVPYNLSLGQKKKCAIAGVISMKPDILLMDEPFLGLDPKSSIDFLDILYKLKQSGVSSILSTHDVNLAYSWADRVVIMKDGRVIAKGGKSILEDEELMNRANLIKPTLARVFERTNYRTFDVSSANKYIRGLEDRL